MRLLRVQVPEFRALKDVDISFEPDFTPQVFPLGSLNGGGKSTLLQLIFVLLNLPFDFFHRNQYIIENNSIFTNTVLELKNKQCSEDSKKIATIFFLTDDNLEIKLDYFYIYNQADSELGFVGIVKLENTNITLKAAVFSKNEDTTSDERWSILSEAISEIRERLFLISPSNQPYLFLSREQIRLLFTSNPDKTYDQVLKGLKDSFPNFYTYDFIDVLTEVCRLERDKDFDQKLVTGIYGTHYEKLENTINGLFVDRKKIIPLTVQQKRHTKDSIQSMGFKLPSGEEIYPEDLSHGELKRLAIFVLIKYHEMQDSIVLIDEIENGFHPDWQYKIVRDLVEWGKNNQYILATHSYELCTAVTPAHVKELEPRLTKEAL